MTNRFAKSLLLVVALVLASVGSGCGYSHQAMYPAGISTVRVNIVGNKTFYQGVEFDLTEALIKEIEQRTPYKVVQNGADTALEGTIINIQQNRLSRSSSGGLIQQLEVQMTASLVWKDTRNGQVLRDRRGVVTVGRYIPAAPVGEPFQIAQHEAVQRMAERFVSAMGEDW